MDMPSKPATKPKSYHRGTMCRFTPQERELLERLTDATGLSIVGVIRLALRDLARRQLGAPAPAKRRKKAGAR